jgi:hypothetical protein
VTAWQTREHTCEAARDEHTAASCASLPSASSSRHRRHAHIHHRRRCTLHVNIVVRLHTCDTVDIDARRQRPNIADATSSHRSATSSSPSARATSILRAHAHSLTTRALVDRSMCNCTRARHVACCLRYLRRLQRRDSSKSFASTLPYHAAIAIATIASPLHRLRRSVATAIFSAQSFARRIKTSCIEHRRPFVHRFFAATAAVDVANHLSSPIARRHFERRERRLSRTARARTLADWRIERTR